MESERQEETTDSILLYLKHKTFIWLEASGKSIAIAD
jgi:hypothetical protein